MSDPSRRDLLKTGALAAGMGLTGLGLPGCGPPTRAPRSFDAEGVWLSQGDTAYDVARSLLERADLSWLTDGDSVLIKLACNSDIEHPAVTSPDAVRATVEVLLDQGAGRVIVADQGGVEYVRLAPGNERYGSTRDLMRTNGLLPAIEESGGEAHFFDEEDYEDGYIEATLPFDTHWAEPMYVARVITEVDHLVLLPRLSSHMLCGYTHALKAAMGWLRDDSRFHVHHKAEFIYEKYVEINYAEELASRLRLVLTAVDAALLDAGPDRGTIAPLSPAIGLASPSIANHDAVSVAVLAHLERTTDLDAGGPIYGGLASSFNLGFLSSTVPSETGISWGSGPSGYTPFVAHRYKDGVRTDRALRRAYELDGGVPTSVEVRLDGTPPSQALRDDLARYSGGMIELSG